MRKYLKNMRSDKKMTQKQLAEMLGISTQYYSLIENGERQQEISVSLLVKLAEVFGVPVDELIRKEGERV